MKTVMAIYDEDGMLENKGAIISFDYKADASEIMEEVARVIRSHGLKVTCIDTEDDQFTFSIEPIKRS